VLDKNGVFIRWGSVTQVGFFIGFHRDPYD
jgi:hypothetical protein